MSDYIHGYTPEEQERLYEQARFLEQKVYEGVDFSRQTRVLELGCGVGAQTEILLRRFPDLRIDGIDSAPAQIERAKQRLAPFVAREQVQFGVGDALHLPYPARNFDGAFLCWFLEHVQEPVAILAELRRVLQPGAIVYLTEVMNATFYVHPYSPATLKYWDAFNDHQRELNGDPYVGAKLGNYLLASGFQDLITQPRVYHYDNRTPKMRADFAAYWIPLLLSGAPGLLAAGKVSMPIVEEMKLELARLKSDPDSVFFYSFIHARATA